MNTENLNGILAQYVQHCKARAAADEGTVWRAVDCFGVNWDIEDSDFPAMFADAMQQAQPTLDNPALQPIGGLQNLMLRDSEVELVRECFRWLYNEDGGDISKRRGRAELFADQINGRFRRVFPRMSKYTMNTANAVFFLNLWEPHANYFYQANEAKAWADYFGYEADFGGGTALDLPRYYTMCNDLLHALENYPEIIALHKAYAEQELGGIDDALHLLVYDILHTAYAEQFYPKGYTRGSTSRERAKAVKEKADRAELCIRIGECEQELQELLANPAALPDLTGCKINHKIPLSPLNGYSHENKKSHAVNNYMGCITHGSTQIVFRTEDLSTDDNAVGGTSYWFPQELRKCSLCDSGVVCSKPLSEEDSQLKSSLSVRYLR